MVLIYFLDFSADEVSEFALAHGSTGVFILSHERLKSRVMPSSFQSKRSGEGIKLRKRGVFIWSPHPLTSSVTTADIN